MSVDINARISEKAGLMSHIDQARAKRKLHETLSFSENLIENSPEKTLWQKLEKQALLAKGAIKFRNNHQKI